MVLRSCANGEVGLAAGWLGRWGELMVQQVRCMVGLVRVCGAQERWVAGEVRGFYISFLFYLPSDCSKLL